MAAVLVTGCNRGIGLELCRQLDKQGEDVIGVCRSPSEAAEKLKIRLIDDVDVSSDTDIERLKKMLSGESLDVLINNAGILRRDSLDELDVEAVSEQFEVNTLGPLRVTRALLKNLHKGSKVAIVTSRMGSIADNTSGGYYGYRISKSAVNMLGVTLARDLDKRGIAVALLHPGMVATEMTGGQGVAVSDSARGLLSRIDELTLETSGGFWHAEGQTLPW